MRLCADGNTKRNEMQLEMKMEMTTPLLKFFFCLTNGHNYVEKLTVRMGTNEGIG